ncbi:hypothetical protein PT015_17205 [Candidatus Mycobacterium wuenschmannii]|uniref:Uncharacterized protein n=1 Tax=Candidatus Mycobacterium wuenschmannii TaxID=3027808 RepID=A0ABY8VWR5_9MYCO|nr:hypothetical protein [Candidatus Mycobacterium wuenschmannii]WIM86617.1 hypothetical protein PT015_17205 [Candidatus Mycobacterium wuenschmannii]
MHPEFITYRPDVIMEGTGTLASASAALQEAQTDLVSINNMLAEHMHGTYHATYRENMMQIEQPLLHLAETVGVHGQVLNSITNDAVMLDASLGAG